MLLIFQKNQRSTTGNPVTTELHQPHVCKEGGREVEQHGKRDGQTGQTSFTVI